MRLYQIQFKRRGAKSYKRKRQCNATQCKLPQRFNDELKFAFIF